MVDGGPRLALAASAIRARHPLSLHGVALSLGRRRAARCARTSTRLAALVDRFEPALVSGAPGLVAAWRGAYRPTCCRCRARRQALRARRRATSVACRTALRRRIALENPSHYLRVRRSTSSDEVDFLVEIARRSGCAPAARREQRLRQRAQPRLRRRRVHRRVARRRWSPRSTSPATAPTRRSATALLIDSHDAPVAPAVWALYERLIARIGPRPTLIERDENVPAFADAAGRAAARARAALAASAARREAAMMARTSLAALPGRLRRMRCWRPIAAAVRRCRRRQPALTRSPASPSTATR
ncbi:MAG: DUF692 family protein [Comamonadaceae bacterium]|nr:DUF692 family protein [Comamonadaceae bacterium]